MNEDGQLVLEVFVSNLDRSIAFYTSLGFAVARHDPPFAVLAWDGTALFLDERPGIAPAGTIANVRVMVPDVDRHWTAAVDRRLNILQPIADREYGLRDFTIEGPDGIGIRFATPR